LSQQLAKLLGLLIAFVIILLLARYCGPTPDVHFKVNDKVAAIDGDTLRSADTEVKLYGIDAPELTQTCTGADGKDWDCGKAAQAKLKTLIGRKAVDCEPRAKDKFNRTVAVCRTSSVPDLGEAMVREGLAVNFGGRTEGPYQDAEIEAEAAKRGLWSGTFDQPSAWRETHPRDGQ
jgi:endonuclease YncB( thermonuclease family)